MDNLLLSNYQEKKGNCRSICEPAVKSDTTKCEVKVAIEIGRYHQFFSEDTEVGKSDQTKSKSSLLILKYLNAL